jgi:thiamine biosynthesis lipoprotein
MTGSITVSALGTTATAVVVDREALLVARGVLLRELRALDLACSRFRADSELAALNRAAGGWCELGPLLWDAVTASLETAEMTDGLVDPTVGRAMRRIGYDTTYSRVLLRDGRLVAASFEPVRGWREIERDPQRRRVRVPAGVELDLGASAKALAADRIAVAIHEASGSGALVSLGGDLGIAGPAPEDGWTIGVDADHAAPPEQASARVRVLAGGMASSGIRVRRWRTAAGEMHHIVDPRTGRPASGPWATVTVAAASCLHANAASTAAIVLGADAPGWLAARGLPARLARMDGSALCVAGWPAEAVAA